MTKARRNFLKQVLAVTVTTVACPHISLGRVIPEIKIKDKKITGIYKVKVTDYPVLNDMWGSIRLNVDAIDPKYSFPHIIVSKVDPTFQNPNDGTPIGVEYTVVSESCPHEGFPVEVLNPDFIIPLFECKKGHGSRYTADGKYFWGVSMKNLERYDLTYDGIDTISIEISAITPVDSVDEIPELHYLSQNYPNPCNDFTEIKYGLEKNSFVRISIHDIKGIERKNLLNSNLSAGDYSMRLSTADLESGNYFFRMVINNTINLTKPFSIVR